MCATLEPLFNLPFTIGANHKKHQRELLARLGTSFDDVLRPMWVSELISGFFGQTKLSFLYGEPYMVVIWDRGKSSYGVKGAEDLLSILRFFNLTSWRWRWRRWRWRRVNNDNNNGNQDADHAYYGHN
jgi:hypothetical protein